MCLLPSRTNSQSTPAAFAALLIFFSNVSALHKVVYPALDDQVKWALDKSGLETGGGMRETIVIRDTDTEAQLIEAWCNIARGPRTDGRTARSDALCDEVTGRRESANATE